MKSLVYDFGQLDTATEQEYTIKIVWKHVSHACSCEQIMLSLTDDIVHSCLKWLIQRFVELLLKF